jgi:hypothetical protein
LELAIDGEVSDIDTASARRIFPGLEIYPVQPYIAQLSESWPVLTPFLHNHPLGRKLGLILARSQQNTILYSDHDVLAFNPPVELIELAGKGTPFYLTEEYEGTSDPSILDRARALCFSSNSRFNSGLLFVPQGALSVDLAAQLLQPWRPPMTTWFTEQTVLNILMRNANAQPLPEKRYVISSRRQFYFQKDVDYSAIVARHFTGTVRHVMYKTGVPLVLEQSKQFRNHDRSATMGPAKAATHSTRNSASETT